jgi:hypothetical protein
LSATVRYGFRTASNYSTALYHCRGKLP